MIDMIDMKECNFYPKIVCKGRGCTSTTEQSGDKQKQDKCKKVGAKENIQKGK